MLRHRFGAFAAVIAMVGTGSITVGATAQASTAGATGGMYPAPAKPCPYLPKSVPEPGSVTIANFNGVGVVHLADGNCAHGAYDVTLNAGQDTYHDLGWKEVAFTYIGPGYHGVSVRSNGDHVSCDGPCWLSSMSGGNWVVTVSKD